MNNEHILQYCNQLLKWGDQYTYHWFWRIKKITNENCSAEDSPLLKNEQSINELLSGYSYINMCLRPEVELYRKRNFFIRLFIWLFNYNQIAKKNILLGYYDMKICLNFIKDILEKNMPKICEHLSTNSISPRRLSSSQVQAIAEAINKVPAESVSLSSQIKNGWARLTTAISNISWFSKEKKLPYNNIDNSIRGVRVYSEKQIEALSLFGMSCQIGRYYSEEEFKKRWKQLVIEKHPDKGGTAEQFREIHEARDLLSAYKNNRRVLSELNSDHEIDLFDKFLNTVNEFRNKSYQACDDKVKKFKHDIDQIENMDNISSSVDSVIMELDNILSTYKMNYLHALMRYHQEENSDKQATLEETISEKNRITDEITFILNIFISRIESAKSSRIQAIRNKDEINQLILAMEIKRDKTIKEIINQSLPNQQPNVKAPLVSLEICPNINQNLDQLVTVLFKVEKSILASCQPNENRTNKNEVSDKSGVAP